MSVMQITLVFGLCALAFIFGMFVSACGESTDAYLGVTSTVPDDTLLLDHLDDTKVSLFYNVEQSAWGVLSADNKLICAGQTVRRALERAVDTANT